MNHLLRTTAIVAVMGCFSIAAQAQQSDGEAAGADTGTMNETSYCDKPWAKVDGNADGFVSKAEASASVENQFGQIDIDGNGELTKTEWVDCLSKMRDQTAAEADRNEDNFAEADTNKDQQIGRDEFRKGSQKAFEDATAANAEDDKLIVLRRYVFLTPQEGQDQSTVKNMSADEAAGRSALTFAALNQNGDDVIDAQEWSERSPKFARDEEWANAQFDSIDSDSTNTVSREEFSDAREQMRDEMTTGSTNADDAAGDQTAEANKSAAAEADGSDKGIPVYIYRFSTM
ncbi:hypothetical protein [Hoeflea sp.]|uniref:hypothetical protein n=1 Tax=Hoeflea sp. TaxID=1940281 RepID=UPI003A8DC27B